VGTAPSATQSGAASADLLDDERRGNWISVPPAFVEIASAGPISPLGLMTEMTELATVVLTSVSSVIPLVPVARPMMV
jgi:hypothetical protein